MPRLSVLRDRLDEGFCRTPTYSLAQNRVWTTVDTGCWTAFVGDPMFRVENADFIADKLAAELLPNQEFREVVKNALEAVERRMARDGVAIGGRIEFDVDWNLLALSRRWYVCCTDNGDGMTRPQLER